MVKSSYFKVVLASLFIGYATKAGEVVYEWDLEAIVRNDMSPDCMNVKDARRALFLAGENGLSQFPGPLVEANEGDTIRIRVTNKHPTEGVAIHWHGIHQKGTPYMDGPAGVTQCVLGSKQSQEYVFDAYPSGTHYWHAHGSLHLADGLSGPIIVRAKEPEPFSYDEERTMFLQDWYIQTSTQQLVGLLNWPFTWIGNPNSLLINGKGIAPECQEGGTNVANTALCLMETCQADPLLQLDLVEVEAGKTYRLRLINAGQLVMMNFAIAGHNLTIVQVEGTNVEPIQVTSVDLAPGQRYDVLVTMDQELGSYLIETAIRLRDIPGVYGQAILHYSGSNASFPEDQPAHPDWDDAEFGSSFEESLRTLDPDEYPEVSALASTDVKRYVVVGTQNQIIVDGEPERLVWAVNNMTNIKGTEPLIGSALKAAQASGWPTEIAGTQLLPVDPPFTWNYTEEVSLERGGPGAKVDSEGQTIIQVVEGDVVEIVLQNARALNGVAEFHPWHIHGHSFWVVGSGKGIYDPSTAMDTYNLENPVFRDTVTLWPLEWIAVRFVANNPGVWFFHCHITSHLVMGMGFNMVVSPDILEDASQSVETCGQQSLTTDVTISSASDTSIVGFWLVLALAILL